MIEEWKDINGYKGAYQVSNMGNVRSLDRIVSQISPCGAPIDRLLKGKLLTSTDNGNGYLIVCLRSGNKRKNFYVHRLVAEHFLDKPCDKEYVNHIDFNKCNNNIQNLEWCTSSENIQHSACNMKHPKSRGKTTNTGHKYIRLKDDGCSKPYKVVIKPLNIDKRFESICEAVRYRNMVIERGGDIGKKIMECLY